MEIIMTPFIPEVVKTSYQPFDVVEIEKRYNATFVGDFSIVISAKDDENIRWSDWPVAVFYQPNPDIEKGHSHYFGLYFHEGSNHIYICDASSAFREPIAGIIADNGEVVFSRYRHDFRTSCDKSVSIDGGRDYTHCSANNLNADRFVKLVIDKDKLVIQPKRRNKLA